MSDTNHTEHTEQTEKTKQAETYCPHCTPAGGGHERGCPQAAQAEKDAAAGAPDTYEVESHGPEGRTVIPFDSLDLAVEGWTVALAAGADVAGSYCVATLFILRSGQRVKYAFGSIGVSETWIRDHEQNFRRRHSRE